MLKIISASAIIASLSAFAISPALANDNGIAAIIHTLHQENGRICQASHFHYGRSQPMADRDQALKAAVRQWSSFTTIEYGSDWGHFAISGNRGRKCEKVGSSLWMCKVKGRPCRSISNNTHTARR